MTKKEILKWRLSRLPTSEEVINLVKDKIITQEEAREILFSTEKEENRDEDSLKSEIKFLRELVERLSRNQPSQVIEIIREVERPYIRWDWYQPYQVWCSSTAGLITNNTLTANAGTTQLIANVKNTAFSNIKTF